MLQMTCFIILLIKIFTSLIVNVRYSEGSLLKVKIM